MSGSAPAPGALVGHERVRAELATVRSQAIALVGPAGVGRRQVARWYAALLNCERSEVAPCGACASCALGPEEHPDYREIAPADTTTTGRAKRVREFRIDQLVERPRSPEEPLSRWLSHRPRFRWRVGVIDDAELLNAAAANAFLKTLEEPPSWAKIVLIAPSLDAMLPTIASRCTPLRCAPVDVAGFASAGPHPALATGRIGPLVRREREPERHTEIAAAVDGFLTGLEGSLWEALEGARALESVWSDVDADDATDLLRFGLRERWPHLLPALEEQVERCELAFERYASTTLATRVLALALRRRIGAGPTS